MKLGEVIVKKDNSGRERKHTAVKCDNCDELFLKPKRFVGKSNKNYCSKKCKDNACKTEKNFKCAICGKKIRRKQSRIDKSESGLFFCCREHKEEAQTLKKGLIKCGHYGTGSSVYRRDAIRHYGARCEWCGFDIEALLEAHHINKNRHDNRTENLIMLCLICHGLIHKQLVEIKNRKAIILDTENKEKISKIMGLW